MPRLNARRTAREWLTLAPTASRGTSLALRARSRGLTDNEYAGCQRAVTVCWISKGVAPMGCRRLLVSIVVVLVTVAATASADPIVVTGGLLHSDADGTLLRISGAGFSTDGRGPSDFSWIRIPIETGAAFSLTHTFDKSFSIATSTAPATATVNGIVHPQVFLHASNFVFVTPSVT